MSLAFLNACKKPEADPGPKDFIKNTWKASKVIRTIPPIPPATTGFTTTVYEEGKLPYGYDFTNVRLQFIDESNYKYTNYLGVTSEGTYAFNSDQTAITFTGGGLDKAVFNIVSPTKDNLTKAVFNVTYSEFESSQINKVGSSTINIFYVPAQ